MRDVAPFLCRHHISGSPVTDDSGRLLGVSEADVVEQERGFDESARFRHRLERRPLRDSDYGAVWLMCDHDANGLPVVDSHVRVRRVESTR